MIHGEVQRPSASIFLGISLYSFSKNYENSISDISRPYNIQLLVKLSQWTESMFAKLH